MSKQVAWHETHTGGEILVKKTFAALPSKVWIRASRSLRLCKQIPVCRGPVSSSRWRRGLAPIPQSVGTTRTGQALEDRTWGSSSKALPTCVPTGSLPSQIDGLQRTALPFDLESLLEVIGILLFQLLILCRPSAAFLRSLETFLASLLELGFQLLQEGPAVALSA